MAANPHRPEKASADSLHPGQLTRQQLRDLETMTMTPFQRFMELVIMLLPNICGIVAILEYQLIPNNSANKNPATYLVMLILFIAAYNIYGWFAALFSICFVFTIVTKVLDMIKRHVLRWQNGVVK